MNSLWGRCITFLFYLMVKSKDCCIIRDAWVCSSLIVRTRTYFSVSHPTVMRWRPWGWWLLCKWLVCHWFTWNLTHISCKTEDWVCSCECPSSVVSESANEEGSSFLGSIIVLPILSLEEGTPSYIHLRFLLTASNFQRAAFTPLPICLFLKILFFSTLL